MKLRLLLLAALAWTSASAADVAGPRRGVDLSVPAVSLQPPAGPSVALPPLDAQASSDLQQLAPAAVLLEEKYVEPVEPQTLYHAALRALIRESGHAGDPEASHRFAALRQAARLLKEDGGIEGERLIDGSVLMREVKPGSLGERGGLRRGDRILLAEDDKAELQQLSVGGRTVQARGHPFSTLASQEIRAALVAFLYGGKTLIVARQEDGGLRPRRVKGESYYDRAEKILLEALRFFGGSRQRPAAEAALRGLTQPLDRHTEIVPARAATLYMDELNGEHAGIGIITKRVGADFVVERVVPGAPADRAGMRPGDILRAVDGTEAADRDDFAEALRRAREPGPRTIRWELDRPGDGGPQNLTFHLQNEIIHHQQAFSELLPGGRGYIYLSQFGVGSSGEVIRLYLDLVKRGARELILDLRFNGGGLGNEATMMASLFLDMDEPVMRFQGRDRQQIVRTEFRSTVRRLPLKILINRHTASASEVLAGALQERGVARLYGEESHGKGSAQNIFKLDGGALVKATTSRWQLPSGRQLDHHGDRLKPDVVVPTRKDQLKPLFMSLHHKLTGQPQTETVDDPVLRRALEDAP